MEYYPSQEKQHYESLISLFKFAFGAIALFSAGIGYFTFSSMSALKAEVKGEVAE